MVMDIHLRDLRYFVAVAEGLSFTRAAEKLYISQPAVSKQVRALEQQLGFPLFERHAGRIALTRRGQGLLDEATKLLDSWRDSYDTVRAIGEPSVITIGMHTAVGRGLNAALHQAFAASGKQLVLRIVPWTDPTAGLLDGTSQAAILWLPVTAPGLESRIVRQEPRYVAVPTGHHLAVRESVTRAELQGESFIALPAVAGDLRRFWLAEAEANQPVRVGMEANSPDEVFEAVAAGSGVAFVAEDNRSLYSRPGVEFVLVDDVAPAELALVWRADDTTLPIQEMLDLITDSRP